MFHPIQKTQFPPQRPLFVWDGECGFCKYWIIVWKSKTTDLNYKTFQEVAVEFPDIPLLEFKKASQLIEPDGSVFSGPDSAFRTFFYFHKPQKYWHNLYVRSVFIHILSDNGYNLIAKNRPLMMSLTKAFWGKNPLKRKPFWILWVAVFIVAIAIFAYFLT